MKFLAKTKDSEVANITAEHDLDEIRKLVSKLYLHLNVEQFENKREQEVVKELENLKLTLQPMEKVN